MSTTLSVTGLFGSVGACARLLKETSAASTPVMMRSMVFSSRAAILLLQLHAHDPGLEASDELGQELARRLVDELALRIELRCRVADEHLGTRQHMTPQLAQDAARVVLPPCAAHRPLRGGEDRDRLVLPGLVGRARGPIDRVLERGAERKVVLRTRDQHAVRCGDFGTKALGRLWHAGVEHVLVEER